MTSKPVEPEELEIHFIKGGAFRTIHCDGVFGEVRSDGNLNLTIYSERPTIPTKVVLSYVDGESQGEVTDKREGKSGMVFDVEANLIFSVDTALHLFEWLNDKLAEADKSGLFENDESGSRD